MGALLKTGRAAVRPEILHFNQHPGDADGAAVSLVNLGLETIIVSLYHQPTQVHLSNYVSGYVIL